MHNSGNYVEHPRDEHLFFRISACRSEKVSLRLEKSYRLVPGGNGAEGSSDIDEAPQG
jgi:hypothetical protein